MNPGCAGPTAAAEPSDAEVELLLASAESPSQRAGRRVSAARRKTAGVLVTAAAALWVSDVVRLLAALHAVSGHQA